MNYTIPEATVGDNHFPLVNCTAAHKHITPKPAYLVCPEVLEGEPVKYHSASSPLLPGYILCKECSEAIYRGGYFTAKESEAKLKLCCEECVKEQAENIYSFPQSSEYNSEELDSEKDWESEEVSALIKDVDKKLGGY